MVDEIEQLAAQYSVSEFAFWDDNMTQDKHRMAAICDEIIRRKLDIRWYTPNGVALWTLDKPTVAKMKQAGCYRLLFGIESGNLTTQKFIHKSIRLDRAKDLISYANSIGLWTTCNFIIGFPYENAQSITDSINYAIECGADFASFFVLVPFPGTPVYAIYDKEGLLESIDGDISRLAQSIGRGGFDTTVFTREELKRWQVTAHSRFLKRRMVSFLNPLRILRKIRSKEDLAYTWRLASSGMRLLFHISTYRRPATEFHVDAYLRGGRSATPVGSHTERKP